MNAKQAIIVPIHHSRSSGRMPSSPEGQIAYCTLLFILILPFTSLLLWAWFGCIKEILTGKVRNFGVPEFFIMLFLSCFTLVLGSLSVVSALIVIKAIGKL